MEPCDFPQSNVRHVGPEGSDVLPLPTHTYTDDDGLPRIISCWRPSVEEVQAISGGAPVWLWVMGAQTPPVSLSVANPFTGETDTTNSPDRAVDKYIEWLSIEHAAAEERGDETRAREIICTLAGAVGLWRHVFGERAL